MRSNTAYVLIILMLLCAVIFGFPYCHEKLSYDPKLNERIRILVQDSLLNAHIKKELREVNSAIKIANSDSTLVK